MALCKSFIVTALLASSFVASSAFAQMPKSAEQREIDYNNCRTEYVSRGMGGDDAANEYCYEREYGSEISGGGLAERTSPGKGNVCFGSVSPCNPYTRPD